MNGDIFSIIFAMIFVPCLFLGWHSVSNWLRISRIQRAYRSLPEGFRQQILTTIHDAGSQGSLCSVLVVSEPTAADSQQIHSKYGGLPYAEAGDEWPLLKTGHPEQASFLIQVKLDESFPRPWAGRLLVVFNRHEREQTIRSYANPAIERHVELKGATPEREWLLQQVRVPRQQVEDPDAEEEHFNRLLDYDPVVLLQTVPALTAELARFTTRPADLLSAILVPNHCSYGFEISDIVQLGGKPEWLIEGSDGCLCKQCGRTMRFLFQFGDLNGGSLLGSSGVCYVFGCDEHPEQPAAFAQFVHPPVSG
ncbi:MAG: hypothetical protein U0941_00310 [Planctomycetaceae bacterium]